MPRRLILLWLLIAGIALLPSLPRAVAAPAQKPPSAGEPAPPEQKPPSAGEPALPADAVTAHRLSLRGRDIAYTATAGTLPLTNAKGDKTAEIFFVAYTLDGADPAVRPLSFAFNGGPGAGAAYLNLGAIGPRVLNFGNGREEPAAEGKAVDNPDTWLDLTDIVFIDPVGTGYSRATIEAEPARQAFLGVRQDLDSLSTIVRLLITRFDRFSSPVYLIGESYGGFRAARLPARLAADEGVPVSGAILLSPVLEFALMGGNAFDPMPWALRLPSYAAVALEAQGKLMPDALQPVERFALGDYVGALAALRRDPAQDAQLYDTLAGFTGLPQALIARWQGRVPSGVFTKEIRHGESELASRYDGSVAGPDPDPSAASPERGDPILTSLTAPLTAGFVTYLRNELGFRTDRRYELLDADVARRWDWHDGSQTTPPGASDDLRRALAFDPKLKVMIVHGMTDLVTPYFMNRYVIDHLPPALTQNRIALRLHPGGHMMYLRPESRAALHADAREMFGAPAE